MTPRPRFFALLLWPAMAACLIGGCTREDQTARRLESAERYFASGDSAGAEIEYVTDFKKIAAYGVFGTPAVVIDGEVKSVGKIPKKEEVKTWIGT